MARLPEVGNFVSIKNPTTGKPSRGQIVDQVSVYEPEEYGEKADEHSNGWLETTFLAQLIKWDSGDRGVRLCYYTRRPGKSRDEWVFAQFAPIMATEEAKILISKINERNWFAENS